VRRLAVFMRKGGARGRQASAMRHRGGAVAGCAKERPHGAIKIAELDAGQEQNRVGLKCMLFRQICPRSCGRAYGHDCVARPAAAA